MGLPRALQQLVTIDKAVQGAVDTYYDLIHKSDKKIGFFKVIRDENYNNTPQEYYFDGYDLLIVGHLDTLDGGDL